MEGSLLQLLTLGGAAGALLWVLKLLTDKDPKLHTHSEIDGLRKDKASLLAVVKTQGEALQASNEVDREILRLLRKLAGVDPDV